MVYKDHVRVIRIKSWTFEETSDIFVEEYIWGKRNLDKSQKTNNSRYLLVIRFTTLWINMYGFFSKQISQHTVRNFCGVRDNNVCHFLANCKERVSSIYLPASILLASYKSKYVVSIKFRRAALPLTHPYSHAWPKGCTPAAPHFHKAAMLLL